MAFALEWVPDGRLFAVGGFDRPSSLLATVEMLQCPWDTEELVECEWRYVAPMHHARGAHGLVYFEGKLIAAGGYGQESVECFTLPTDDLPGGQWVIIRPMIHAKELLGILPFGENLLFVGKCKIGCLYLCTSFRLEEGTADSIVPRLVKNAVVHLTKEKFSFGMNAGIRAGPHHGVVTIMGACFVFLSTYGKWRH